MQGFIKILCCVSIFCLLVSESAFGQNCPGFSLVGNGTVTDVTCKGDMDGSITILVNNNNGGILASYIDGITTPGLLQDTMIGGATLFTETFDDLPAGTYDVIIGDDSPCLDTFSITVEEPIDPFTLTIDTVNNANCGNNGFVQVVATGGWQPPSVSVFTWDGLDEDNIQVVGYPRVLGPSISALEAGTYTVFAADDNGCIAQADTVITGSTPFSIDLSIIDGSLPLELGDSIDLLVTPNVPSSTIQYTWFPTTNLQGLSTSFDSVRVQPCNETTYLVYAVDPIRLCDDLDSITITLEGEFDPWIPNAFEPASFISADNVFKVFGFGIESVEMEIFDRKGALVYQNPEGVLKGEWDGTLGTSGTEAVTGKYLYVLKIRSICGEIVTRSGGISLLR